MPATRSRSPRRRSRYPEDVPPPSRARGYDSRSGHSRRDDDARDRRRDDDRVDRYSERTTDRRGRNNDRSGPSHEGRSPRPRYNDHRDGPSGRSHSPRPSSRHSKPRSRSKSVDRTQPNFNPSGLLAAETNTVARSDGTSTFLKYNEPPEARRPSQGWRLYVFKGKEQVGVCRKTRFGILVF